MSGADALDRDAILIQQDGEASRGTATADAGEQALEAPTWTGGPSVYVVVNGPLAMSAGKLAAQTFQACQRLLDRAAHDPDLAQRLAVWRQMGTRTIVREARTEQVFERVQREVPGVGMVDEGMNEVPPGSLTSWASIPLWPSERPKVLSHKRVPLA